MLELLVAKFFAIYFWVFITAVVVNIIVISSMPKEERPVRTANFLWVLSLTLFIMSFSY